MDFAPKLSFFCDIQVRLVKKISDRKRIWHFARLIELCRCAAKLGGTSEMKIKIIAFYFAFHSVCTTLPLRGEDTHTRKCSNKFGISLA